MASVGYMRTSRKPGSAPRRDRHFRALQGVQLVIDGLVEQVALIDCEGTIIAVNESWRRQVDRQARTGLRISRDYIAFLEDLISGGDEGARRILRAFKEIAAGTRRTFRFVYKGLAGFEGYDFNVVLSALNVHDARHVLVSVHDITELVGLKRQRRRLGSQVLHAQEVERRRMARELHDSTSQMLVALQLDLSRLASKMEPGCEEIIADCKEAVHEIHQEIRTFSFLAHPPTLAKNELGAALENLARGFAARTGLEIDVDVSDCGVVSASIEAAIYRLSQEALANIHRHAGATRASLLLKCRGHYVHLVIKDNGIGFDSDLKPLGVGVTGMKERVRDLGGRLSIHRATKGMTLTVSLHREKRMLFTPPIGAR